LVRNRHENGAMRLRIEGRCQYLADSAHAENADF
jgi:hypothetical protein